MTRRVRPSSPSTQGRDASGTIRENQSGTFARSMLRLAAGEEAGPAFSRFLEAAMALNCDQQKGRPSLVAFYDGVARRLFLEAYSRLVLETLWDGSGLKDVLGDFFCLHVDSRHCFTPQACCDALPGICCAGSFSMRVADYNCRSGRLLLAAARMNRGLRLYGADRDMTMVRMSLLNLCMNGLTGEIAWYDACRDVFFGAWQVDLDGRGRPVIRRLQESRSLILLNRKARNSPYGKLVFGF